MPKTQREMLLQLAAQIGGERADRLRAVLSRKSAIDDILDRPMSDEDFAAQWEKLEGHLPKLLEKMQGPEWEKPATWGWAN